MHGALSLSFQGIPTMPQHEFTVVFSIPRSEPIDDVIERLGVNCSDALVGTGRDGFVALDFIREAATFDEARASAVAHVMDAVPGAELVTPKQSA
jgi:hypothetical protein